MNFGKTVFASMLGSALSFLAVGLLLIVIVSVMVTAAITGALSGLEGGKPVTDVKENSVLHLELNDPIVERTSDQQFKINFNTFEPEKSIGLDDLLEDIDKAARDERIEGIFLDLSAVMASPSTMQDIREELVEFKESGKWIVAYSESYSQGAYYLASTADEVYLYPEGMLEFYGLYTELAYFGNMFDRLGVNVQVVRGPDNKYKSAVETFTMEKMSDKNREQVSAYLNDIWSHWTAHIAESRGMSEAQLNNIADNLLIRKAEDGIALGLIDGVKYRDEITSLLRERSGLTEDESTEESEEEEKKSKLDFLEEDDSHSARLVSLADYRTAKVEDDDSDAEDDAEASDDAKDPWDKDQVAVVYAVGAIESGEGDDMTIGSDRIARALRDARLDEDVKAVVLRVNSPGGSALASDVIWRETKLIKEAGKPFVVSMGDVAASGGYYIAAAADKIFANENTITGSIGVFGIIPDLSTMLDEKVGITFDRVSTNEHAGILSSTRPMGEDTKAWLDTMITDVYDEFLMRVAEGRGMTTADVDSIAQGRVWSGTAAKRVGLIDEFGNLEDAINAAVDMAAIEDYEIRELPEMKDPFKEFMKEFGAEAQLLQLVEETGIDPRHGRSFLEMKQMLESKERVQTRLPFSIVIE
jgi:protease-4